MYVIREAQEQKCRIASLQEGTSVDPYVYLWIKLKEGPAANDASSWILGHILIYSQGLADRKNKTVF